MTAACAVKPHYEDDLVQLWHGDCLDILATLPDNSVHAVVADPPYGLANTAPEQIADTIVRWVNGDRTYMPGGSGFMGKAWDAFVPPVVVWDECLRVLKPGGYALAFAGSRTHDLMTLGLRLAGFEIRDSIAWLYGSGFPKSLDVSKAIDKAAGAERDVIRERTLTQGGGTSLQLRMGEAREVRTDITAPATPDAERWQGWGTALKPAIEPIVVARKPLTGTVAANVLEHGTGALNIDGCRIPATDKAKFPAGIVSESEDVYGAGAGMYADRPRGEDRNPEGRWPPNVVLDDSQAAELDRQSGESVSRAGGSSGTHFSAGDPGVPTPDRPRGGHDDAGGASRFFPTFRYEAKAPTSERPRVNGIAHPTVKPLELMRWLVRLVTPPGGTVLDPFAGSGTTLEAALIEGFQCIGIEREADYLPLIRARITKPLETVLDMGVLA